MKSLKLHLLYSLVMICGFQSIMALDDDQQLSAVQENERWESWDSLEGLSRLQRSDAKENFWKLVRFYESQKYGSYCSVATSVIALNALAIEPPQSIVLGKYRMFTQDGGFTVFEELFPDVIKQIFDQMDHPAQIFFAWTCKKYCRHFFKPDQFDGQQTLDKCARAGYRRLVAECVEEYEWPVDMVTICEAARGGHSYKELWKSFLRVTRGVSDAEVYPLAGDPERSGKYLETAEWEACGGHLDLASALARCSWTVLEGSPSLDERYETFVNLPPVRLIYHLGEGGHAELAKIVYAHLSDHQRTSLPKSRFIGLLFEGAIAAGISHWLIGAWRKTPLFCKSQPCGVSTLSLYMNTPPV